MFKPSILIDFDKTISPIHGFEEPPNPEAIELINRFKEKYKIVIYSCRANPDVCTEAEYLCLLEYLNVHNIYYDEIARDKPLFVAIIDDRAFNPLFTDWKIIEKIIEEKY